MATGGHDSKVSEMQTKPSPQSASLAHGGGGGATQA
jgi:hypothetical protein